MNSRKLKKTGNIAITECPLCRNSNDLRKSHIVPQFVYDWLKRTSGTGFIRLTGAINQRVQDGFTERMLCTGCEERLSQWEKQFAEKVFIPLHDTEVPFVAYEDWMGKFCASIVWRVLFLSREFGLNHFAAEQLIAANSAMDAWRAYMLGSDPAPILFANHLLLLDPIETSNHPSLPDNLNRYLMRCVEIDVCRSAECAFVYAKLCRIAIFGFINMPDAAKWIGTCDGYGDGHINRKENRHIPQHVFQYMLDRASSTSHVESTISDRQRNKIEEAKRSNPETYAGSETVTASLYDAALKANLNKSRDGH